jgi:chromo domain-containing protein 1
MWRVSLKVPVPFDEENRHLVRIFPHGGAMFLTEDVILNDTHKALQIVKWFCNEYISKKNAKNWKLVFRPAIREWLFDMADQTKDFR